MYIYLLTRCYPQDDDDFGDDHDYVKLKMKATGRK